MFGLGDKKHMKNLLESLHGFKCNVLVIGDAILDVFLYGTASRLSQEAPVPVVNVNKVCKKAGGAANVACNLKDLGCDVTIVGCVGNDDNGDYLAHDLGSRNINIKHLVKSDSTITSVKTRVVAHDQHIVRFDHEQTNLDTASSSKIYSMFNTLRGSSFDVVIISDYNKGMIDKVVCESVSKYFSDSFIIVDPKPANMLLYKGVHCITPNTFEAGYMSNLTDVDEMAVFLKHKLELDNVIITLSGDGVVLYDVNNKKHKFSAYVCKSTDKERHHRIDVTGAGDALISTLGAAIGCGINMVDAVQLANVAASVVVNKLGTATCSFAELKKEVFI